MLRSPPRPRPLRWHLLVLTLGTLLPLVLFGVATMVVLLLRERQQFRDGVFDRTRALSTAVDAELKGHLLSLKLLARSRELELENLAGFLEEIERTLPTQPYWCAIHLSRPSGDEVLTTGTEPRPGQSDERASGSFQAAAGGAAEAVGDLEEFGTALCFRVRVPVLRAGELVYVLSATVDPGFVSGLIAQQPVPADWVLVVLDGNRRIVARTANHETWFGAPASPSLRAALEQQDEGWFRGRTLEGADVYTPFVCSTATRWSVAFGVPVEVVEAGARRALGGLAIGIVGSILAAVLLAGALGRRILQPMSSLVRLGRDLGRDAPLRELQESEVAEVNAVGAALLRSAAAVRQRERALRDADRSKDEFLAMLGHELRNPLSAISSAAQVLQMASSSDGAAREPAAIVGRQVQHMTRLVDDLLDVGRVSTGKVALALEPLELGRLARELVDTLRRGERLREHELTLEVRPVWIQGDEARIEQILSNLVGNALKYTPPGGHVRVRVAREGNDAVLEVEDDGIGLTDELMERAFDLFVQGERSIDRQLGGLGIGLTLVRRLSELHGGGVAVHSPGPDRGARFTVHLPAIEPPREEPPRAERVRPRAEHRRVLLVEDNADARRTLRAALELHGFEVDEAERGEEGLALAFARRPAAAVIDIGLPDLDGYEVARRLRRSDAGGAMLLVALTGYGQPESRRASLDAGFDVHLTKPVPPGDLAALLAAERPSESATRAGQRHAP